MFTEIGKIVEIKSCVGYVILRCLLCQVEMVGRQSGVCLESSAEVSAGDITDMNYKDKNTMFVKAPTF